MLKKSSCIDLEFKPDMLQVPNDKLLFINRLYDSVKMYTTKITVEKKKKRAFQIVSNQHSQKN